jgi:hypothetical protein
MPGGPVRFAAEFLAMAGATSKSTVDCLMGRVALQNDQINRARPGYHDDRPR